MPSARTRGEVCVKSHVTTLGLPSTSNHTVGVWQVELSTAVHHTGYLGVACAVVSLQE